MSLLEAMSAGVPVIASPVGGIQEVVVDGKTGLMTPDEGTTLKATLEALSPTSPPAAASSSPSSSTGKRSTRTSSAPRPSRLRASSASSR